MIKESGPRLKLEKYIEQKERHLVLVGFNDKCDSDICSLMKKKQRLI